MCHNDFTELSQRAAKLEPLLYLHNYACWTAARAVQNPATMGYRTDDVKVALDKIGISKYLIKKEPLALYEKIHLEIVTDLLKKMNKGDNEFGIGSKIVAIYFKTALIIPALSSGIKLSKFLKSIYPPIDSNVLIELGIRGIRWTSMDNLNHSRVISTMIEKKGEEIAEKGFWIMDYSFNNSK